MRPDLPWNVAGISTEAREAARAAARREGLSVGEWLTRRIVSGLADMSEPRGEWTTRGEYRPPEPERQKRDSDAMLDRVSRSETETAEVYRRIEEQLRGMARRLDASERSQTESNRVMSKAAVEMNIAAREQAQAFDQLGAHVANLNERLDRVESRDPGDGVRDAVKALHQGLSRLADQIAQTASQSATQISSLANNLETVASRVGQARHDSLVATQALETRVTALDERVHTLEAAAQANAGTIDRALQAIEAQKRAAAPNEAISRLEDSVHRLEQRADIDPNLDRRFARIERGLSDLASQLEPEEEHDHVDQSLRKIALRLDTLETAQREAAAELRKAALDKPKPPVFEAPPPVTITPAAASFAPLPAFEPLHHKVESPVAAATPIPAIQPPPVVALEPEEPDDEPPLVEPPPLPSPTDEGKAPAVESYLAAARRSARVAAQAETERSATIGGMRWSAKAEDGPKRTRPLIVGMAALVGIAVIAGVILSRQDTPAPPRGVTIVDKHAAAKAKPTAIQTASLQSAPFTPAAPVLPAKPAATGKPTTTGLMPSGVPGPQQAMHNPAVAHPMTARLPANAPLDRLTAAANTGNAKAQLIVGLKYLEGDGVPTNDGEAARWLARAADAGEPVAQYRLGTLYERGRGVAADAAKAVRWYQAAANQGSRKAMHNLAVAYAEGTGVRKDFAEASRWFLKAANLGLSDSQFNLAVLYERGLGVPQNLVDAYKWYAIAAAQGDGEAKTRLNAISGQLDGEGRAAAQHAADTFRAGQLDARANVAPTVADVTRG